MLFSKVVHYFPAILVLFLCINTKKYQWIPNKNPIKCLEVIANNCINISKKYVYINISEKKPSRQEWTIRKFCQKVLSPFLVVFGVYFTADIAGWRNIFLPSDWLLSSHTIRYPSFGQIYMNSLTFIGFSCLKIRLLDK